MNLEERSKIESRLTAALRFINRPEFLEKIEKKTKEFRSKEVLRVSKYRKPKTKKKDGAWWI